MLHCSKTTVSTTICRNAQGTAPKRNAHDVATKGVLYVKNYDTPQLSPTPASTSAISTIPCHGRERTTVHRVVQSEKRAKYQVSNGPLKRPTRADPRAQRRRRRIPH